MKEAIAKALKWYIIAGAVILGFWALVLADRTNSVKPVIIAVLGLGFAYIMSYFWKELKGKILFYSFALVAGCGYLSKYIPDLSIAFLRMPLNYDFFLIWAGAVFVIGVPVMTVIFLRYGD